MLDHVDVDVLDRAHEAQVAAPGARAAHDAEEQPVVAAEPDRCLSVAVEPRDDLLVELADEHHLRDLDGVGVGDAQAINEFDGQARGAPCRR